MPLRIDIITLFREMFEPFRSTSIVGRAVRDHLVDIHLTDLRSFAADKYGSVDDAPFGGGPGMVLLSGPVFKAVEYIRGDDESAELVMLSPQGERFSQETARELARAERLVLLAGRYEGFDERIRLGLKPREISIGDYVLSGGELPAMVVMDCVVRLVPGVLGDEKSVEEESFSEGILEYPHYTRPREFRGMSVPEVLVSGDHGRIARWRAEEALRRTRRRRSDLLEGNDRKEPEDEPDNQ